MNVREWALPVYTILMQLSVGITFVAWIIRSKSLSEYGREKVDTLFKNLLLVVTLTIIVAMVSSHFHLSRPYLSFLSVFNFHTSWLSREILFSVLFFISIGSLSYILWYRNDLWRLRNFLGWVAVGLGWITVYSMAKIYTLPTQIAWNSSATPISFFLTTLLLGIVAFITLLIMDLKYIEFQDLSKVILYSRIIQRYLVWFVIAAVIVVAALLSVNIFQIVQLANDTDPTAQASLQLLLRLYPLMFGLRWVLTITGVGILAVVAYIHLHKGKSIKEMLLPAYITCLLILVGEILGRFLFYAIHIRIGL